MAADMIFSRSMKNHAIHIIYALAASLALVSGGPALAQPAGKLETLPLGQYRCSVPGSAAGQAWLPVEAMDFVIGNASSYTSNDGSGTYLATAKMVTFTRGPMKGVRLERRTNSILQKREADGELGRLRCVRSRSAG